MAALLTASLTLFAGAAWAAPQPEPAQTPLLRPLPAVTVTAFRNVRDDRPPAHIVRGIHYVVSNENRHYLFRDAVRGKGGVFVGVGTDQNYLMAGWARPEVLVLLDFDQVVVDLHRVYRLAFLNAETPAAFMKLWAPRGWDRLTTLINQSEPDPLVRARMHRAFIIGRVAVHRRLERLHSRYGHYKIASFLDDAQQYTFLREMFRTDRVFMVRGDLTADRSIHDVGEAARAQGLPVRVLYLSNAERYFNYNADFKTSMLGLPMDDRSVVIRTSDYHDGRYQYSSQSGGNFQAWLHHGSTTSAKKMLAYKEYPHGAELALIRVSPDHLPPLPAVRPEPGDRVRFMTAKRGPAPAHLRPARAERAQPALSAEPDPSLESLNAAIFF